MKARGDCMSGGAIEALLNNPNIKNVTLGSNGQRIIGTTSQKILSYNENRKSLVIQNQHPSNTLYVSFGKNAQANATSIRISPNGNWELENMCVNEVFAIADGASTNICVFEGIESFG